MAKYKTITNETTTAIATTAITVSNTGTGNVLSIDEIINSQPMTLWGNTTITSGSSIPIQGIAQGYVYAPYIPLMSSPSFESDFGKTKKSKVEILNDKIVSRLLKFGGRLSEDVLFNLYKKELNDPFTMYVNTIHSIFSNPGCSEDLIYKIYKNVLSKKDNTVKSKLLEHKKVPQEIKNEIESDQEFISWRLRRSHYNSSSTGSVVYSNPHFTTTYIPATTITSTTTNNAYISTVTSKK